MKTKGRINGLNTSKPVIPQSANLQTQELYSEPVQVTLRTRRKRVSSFELGSAQWCHITAAITAKNSNSNRDGGPRYSVEDFFRLALKKEASLSLDKSLGFDRENNHPACLCLYDREGLGVVRKIPLREVESLALLNYCIEHQIDIAEFVAEAVREKLTSSLPSV